MRQVITSVFSLLLLLAPCHVFAEKAAIKAPPSALDISKENTYPNPTQDLPRLQPSELAKNLLDTSKIPIENPDLIRMFNETSISNAPLAVGYRAKIYLGQWPLNYESTETTVNWEYQQINRNFHDNRGGKTFHALSYHQDTQKIIQGGLTAPIKNAEDVKKMMLLKAMSKTNLPLAFQTVVGYGTKHSRVYNIAPSNLGYLTAYAPAVNEKGKVTFGEVYLVLKGNQRHLLIKNVTSQGIGAWIPVQDHVSFGFVTSPTPR
ncbi:YfkD family protein [Ectobacillus sp. JY-23]|uniref:YfkD famly protein n=1 Tax=Ectobacillus sp. JY-23 TaxID=2933872 RepID=UPI001FF2F7F2|nr:YfkD famly protein [Ectobacillus sp. JY-23]UOY91701.1 YfkD family protein [Ectobacillus sp. JY-23]